MIDISSFQNYPLIFCSIISIGIVYVVYINYNEYYYLNRIIQVEAEREQEGLPREVLLTPEDFRENPELVEIFGITDVENNFNVDLETNEHLNYLENHEVLNTIEAFIEAFMDIIN